MPQVKLNNVSQSKIDMIASGISNLTASITGYFCYSTTSKKNIIRIIDTITGNKALFKFHESAIRDIKIQSIQDSIYIATCDDVSGCVIWKIEKDLSTKIVISLKESNIKTISCDSQNITNWICIFDNNECRRISTNELLFKFDEVIVNVAFTSDSAYLFAATKNSIYVYINGKVTKLVDVTGDIMQMLVVGNQVIISMDESSETDNSNLVSKLQAWRVSDLLSNIFSPQIFKIQFPISNSKAKSFEGNQVDSWNHRLANYQNYVILSHV